jgi:hypothetical protein
MRHGQVHQQLGLGPGHEHVLVDPEIEPVEFALAGEVGQRLARRRARHQRREALLLLGGQGQLGAGQHLGARKPGDVCQQHLGGEGGRVGTGEGVLSRGQGLAEGRRRTRGGGQRWVEVG